MYGDYQDDGLDFEDDYDAGDDDFEDDDEDDFDDGDDSEALYGRSVFADPGGNSALRAATRSNPRNLPCPECERPNMLTPEDRRRGYRCDICADLAESGRGY
jgi:hypothetical protein